VGLILLSCQQKGEFYRSQLLFPSLHLVKLSCVPNTTDSLGVVLFHCHQNITLNNRMIFFLNQPPKLSLMAGFRGRKIPSLNRSNLLSTTGCCHISDTLFPLPQSSPLLFRDQLRKSNNIMPAIYLFLSELVTTLLIFSLSLFKRACKQKPPFGRFNAVTNMKDSLFAQFSS